MFLRLLSVVLLFSSAHLLADDWTEASSLLPKGTQLSYLVVNPDNNHVIAQSHQTTLRTPASIQKLLTATAATLYLGKDFRYRTIIEGQKEKIKQHQYNGDLYFHFVGDPTLLRSDIHAMLMELKSLGIQQITGRVFINQSHFNGYQWSDGQPWNDLGVCYTSPANAIIVNKNCVQGNLSVSTEDPHKARLFIPDYEPISLSSDVSVVTKAQRDEQFCALEVTRGSHNQYHLWGCMVPRDRAFPLAFSVNDPFSYVKSIITSELSSLGIKVTGKVLLDPDTQVRTIPTNEILVKHDSRPLNELLQLMMKKSNNLIADSLFKTVGGAYFHQAGNFRNGSLAIKQILKAQHIDLENAYIADGSGLSRHNLMSAELFMSVLNFVYKNDKQLNLLSTLPISGIDGTLKNYRGLRKADLKGKVIAKTGSMKGVSNLLGLVKTPKGDRLFVIMLNGYNLEGLVKENGEPKNKYAFLTRFIKQVISESK